jgi:PAS domain S-box-containing protein
MNSPTYTLLIVEDFLADRELYRRSLSNDSSCTYCLLEAESVAEGLEICHSHKIDAILLDYMLPDADGLEFLAQLSAQSSNSPPVVMMTGQGSESIAVRAIKAGAQDYLVKRDLTPELLQLTMRKAIENHRLRLQLQQCQDRFQMSIDNMRECVGLYSVMRDDAGEIIDFRFDYLNPAALESNRMSSDDIGKSLCEMFPAFRTSGLFEEYCKLVTTGQPLIKEDLVYEDVFGGERIVKYYAIQASILNNGGFMVSWRDETAQRQAEIGLQTARQQIIDIWESMTDAYVTVDREWRMIYANPAATQIVCHLTNLAPTEFLGRSYWDLFPSLVGGDVEREFRRALTDRVVVHLDVWFEPTGSWFESHLYPAAEGVGIYFRDITDRQRMEAERLAAEQERDRFFNLSIDLLATISFDGYFTRLNPAWENTLGYTNAELIAQPFIDLIHPDDRMASLATAQNVSTGELVTSFENRYRCKDGSYRWLLWSARPYLEQNLMYAIAHDITERKQMEAALRESERKFSAIFEQSFELMGLVSLDGVLLEVNQTALDSIAARREDVTGKHFWDAPWWHTPQLQQQLKDAIDRAGQGEFSRYEVQFPHPSGVTLITDFSLKPVFDDADRVWTIVAEAHDITERKRAERDLQESQERLRTGIAVAGVGLARFDYATNLVALSPEAAALFGFALDTSFVTREQIHDTFHPDERAELEEIIAQVIDLAGTGWFARDHQVVWPNGEVRCLSVRKQVFFDRSGAVARPSYAVLAAIDITERNRDRSELEERNQELDSFVHVVSHDLKAPLRAISNLSQWIEDDLDGSLPAASQEQMNMLRARVKRMQATIDGLLDYARIGRTEDSIEPVDVSELIAETIDTLAPLPTFQIAIAHNLPTLYTKRMLLSQVFANLIGNGIKHHDRLDGSLHIGIAERRDVYEFAIADDGPGIAPEQHDRIFRIFQAVNPQNRSDSTGIGLAIVKKIVEAEGGTIRLESQIGRGTTFYFTWPKGGHNTSILRENRGISSGAF